MKLSNYKISTSLNVIETFKTEYFVFFEGFKLFLAFLSATRNAIFREKCVKKGEGGGGDFFGGCFYPNKTIIGPVSISSFRQFDGRKDIILLCIIRKKML